MVTEFHCSSSSSDIGFLLSDFLVALSDSFLQSKEFRMRVRCFFTFSVLRSDNLVLFVKEFLKLLDRVLLRFDSRESSVKVFGVLD